jgi:hypothetical protein
MDMEFLSLTWQDLEKNNTILKQLSIPPLFC